MHLATWQGHPAGRKNNGTGRRGFVMAALTTQEGPMARYGADYRHWGAGRYDRDTGYHGRDRSERGAMRGWGPSVGGYAGMRSDAEGGNWRDFAGESGWFGEATPGYSSGAYDADYGGAFRRGRFENLGGRYDQGMHTGGYGLGYGGGYSERETGYGGIDYGWGGGGSGRMARSSQQRHTRAGEIMTENPECVTPDTKLSDVARRMRELDVGIIPVVESQENRRLQGVITDRDIAIRAVADGKDGNTTVRECMTTDVETVNKNDPISNVLNVMQREQVRRVPVTDREGRLVGIIAQADLAVDYASGDMSREQRVGDTIERISEPANPRRAAMAAQGRGGESSEQSGRTQKLTS